METNKVFAKTPLGQAEIDSNAQAMSMTERRILILVNGEKDVATLARHSLCEEASEILESLLDRGFIERVEIEPAPQRDQAPEAQSADEEEIGVRDFLCNTLLTYGNQVRVGKLVDKIKAVEDMDILKTLIDPWYQAISETPGGMYQADKLKDILQDLISTEEVNGLR